ncbi:MAG: hypothetical protein M0R00_03135 [Candidatus Omnitrophica bacterium]|jgi:hypothetical protein|nr:hypothetical protein [Candidatus Omnitrophota bacterium]
MVKKAKSKKAGSGAKVKKGDKYVCNYCGMTVTVADPCDCESCGISCCGEPMECC